MVAAMSMRGAKSFLRLVARHPALSTGIAAFGVIVISVSVNGLYEQQGRHPNPMLVTRAIPAAGAQAPSAGRSQTPDPARFAEVAEPAAPGTAAPAATDAAEAAAPVEIDNIPAPAPRPLERPDPEQTASIETGGRVAAVPQPAAPRGAAGEARFAALSEAERVKKIQAALASAQVAELSVDGVLGEKTRAAIRTFEALEGMDVTGTPNEKVLKRLAAIGLVD
ncbi:peptidoglycan-binding protein (cell wall degradation activity) [Aurantimonas sp. 22II-16-19i]|nr:peptidoglycan-binding protein (cell wall degradation activity) [Aurantimonas sp. 22II-16-19i]